MHRGREIIRAAGVSTTLGMTIGMVYLYSLIAREAVRCYYGAVWGVRLVLYANCQAFLDYSAYLLIVPVTLFCFSALAIRYERELAHEIVIQLGWFIIVLLILWAVCSWTYAFVPPHPAAAIYSYK